MMERTYNIEFCGAYKCGIYSNYTMYVDVIRINKFNDGDSTARYEAWLYAVGIHDLEQYATKELYISYYMNSLNDFLDIVEVEIKDHFAQYFINNLQ